MPRSSTRGLLYDVIHSISHGTLKHDFHFHRVHCVSISVECNGDDSCTGSAIECPLTTGCALYCDPNATSPCGAANVYIADIDGLYNESLLDISCESGDCILYQNWGSLCALLTCHVLPSTLSTLYHSILHSLRCRL